MKKKRFKRGDRELLQTGILCLLFLVTFVLGGFGGIVLKYLILQLN